jgi:cell wall-associated NlpC family hydrolase
MITLGNKISRNGNIASPFIKWDYQPFTWGIVLFSVCLFTLSACKTSLPKTTENSRPTKGNTSAYKKYSKIGIEVDSNTNLKLLDEILAWWGTPYKFGGESKAGADCSGFVQMVYSSVYQKKLPRTSKQQYEFCKKIGKNQLKEGDLVFFDTGGKGVSHVGIYLKDNRFAHASTTKGVMVNSLTEEYYQKTYKSGGRVEL